MERAERARRPRSHPSRPASAHRHERLRHTSACPPGVRVDALHAADLPSRVQRLRRATARRARSERHRCGATQRGTSPPERPLRLQAASFGASRKREPIGHAAHTARTVCPRRRRSSSPCFRRCCEPPITVVDIALSQYSISSDMLRLTCRRILRYARAGACATSIVIEPAMREKFTESMESAFAWRLPVRVRPALCGAKMALRSVAMRGRRPF